MVEAMVSRSLKRIGIPPAFLADAVLEDCTLQDGLHRPCIEA